MKLNEIVFTDNLPSLDLHGLDRDSARIMVIDFILDNKKTGNEIVAIIHGIGTGVLRREVHECLRVNKNVIEYKTNYFNNGMTLVKIKLD